MVPIQKRLVSGILSLALFVPSVLFPSLASADGCVSVPTSDGTLTAAVVASSGQSVTGDVNATGCDIGVYVGRGVWDVTISASVHDANRYGVFSVGGNVAVTGSTIYNIGNHIGTTFAPNGAQTGIGVLFGSTTVPNVVATGSITNNKIYQYQKGGIVIRGSTACPIVTCPPPGATTADITGNTVTGLGPVDFIAQNGIQVSDGALATAFTGNTVSGNIYTQSGSCAPSGIGSCVGVVSTGVLFYHASGNPQQGVVSSSNHVFGNQADVTIVS